MTLRSVHAPLRPSQPKTPPDRQKTLGAGSEWSGGQIALLILNRRACTLNLGEDVGGLGRPDERFRRALVISQIGFDGDKQFVEALEDAAAESIDGKFAAKAFDPVQPANRRGSVVDREARVVGPPAAILLVLLGGVVVDDGVQLII